MGLLVLGVLGLFLGLVGLVRLWLHEGPHVFLVAVGILVLDGILCFSAESWYSWLGYSRGDGQVFIGLYLAGMAFWAIAVVFGLFAGLVASFRPKPRILNDGAGVAPENME